ncbi:site-specific DNA-methyltransferase [Mesorhizobium sp. B2-4-19]|uniref:DNA methyltransferase n=1 Tax=Mesorhizobium sp. B2-4-19 TaxID=2589930 RepID=UPI00112684FC|nr:DNA methyltransferase [Mesorhizobium sp. B2-4-19]TPK63060.1 site-specific DNA-methyltransferase [Mesorhizobium sp. B2-4-19]
MELKIFQFSKLQISSPKRDKGLQTGWESFFPYYAGYPEIFVKGLLESANLSPTSIILDPWNGSGTTTFVASRLGYEAVGLDINPVMVVIARARMLPCSEADSLLPLALALVGQGPRPTIEAGADPLEEWFAPQTATAIRQIETAIRESTIGGIAPLDGATIGRISGLAATLYLGLFAACRSLSRVHRSTNPTWMRKPKSEEQKTTVPPVGVVAAFIDNVRAMANELAASEKTPGIAPRWAIEVADTTSASLKPDSVDLVVTSPPYCTRIDYTAATRVELAILAPILPEAREDLSRNMIGSIRVPVKKIAQSADWGETCNRFLDRVRQHDSKASSTYYYSTHLDYFDKIDSSFGRISSTLRPGGIVCLVVQDSYYKDVHNDLPTIVTEMCGRHGLRLGRRDDFRFSRSMARVNRHTKIYGRPSVPTEAVLCFEKAA